MSDFFGISNALKGMSIAYFQSSRATGRTISMVESLKDGDRVCFVSSKEADRVKRLCLERKIDVECIVVDPVEAGRLFERGPSQGRTILDHTWVEQYYLNGLKQLEKEIDCLERQSSRFSEAHHETKRKAVELSKWQNFE